MNHSFLSVFFVLRTVNAFILFALTMRWEENASRIKAHEITIDKENKDSGCKSLFLKIRSASTSDRGDSRQFSHQLPVTHSDVDKIPTRRSGRSMLD